jgi:hypothetical protein
MAVQRDGRTMLIVSTSGETHVVDASTGHAVRSIPHRRFNSMVAAREIDGKVLLAVLDYDRGISRIFDVDSGKPVGKLIRHDGEVQATSIIAFRGRTVLAMAIQRASKTREFEAGPTWIELWDVALSKRVARSKRTLSTDDDVLLHRDGDTMIAVQRKQGPITVRDALTLEPRGKSIPVKGDLESMGVANIGGADVILATVSKEVRPSGVDNRPSETYAIHGWRLRDHKPAFAPIAIGDQPLRALVGGNLNGRDVVGCGVGSAFQLWLTDGRRALNIELDARVTGIVFLPPSRIVVATSKGLVAIDWAE